MIMGGMKNQRNLGWKIKPKEIGNEMIMGSGINIGVKNNDFSEMVMNGGDGPTNELETLKKEMILKDK